MKKLFLIGILITLLAFISNNVASALPMYTIIDLGTLGSSYSSSTAINNDGQVFGHSIDSAGTYCSFIWEKQSGMRVYSGNPTTIRRINDSGDVVGTSRDNYYLWAQINDSLLAMPDGYQSSVGEGINNIGQAVGHATVIDIHNHNAVLWNSIDEVVVLGTLSDNYSYAYGINDSSIVVGSATVIGESYSRAFIWDSINGMQNLNNFILPGHDFEFIATAADINNTGYIAATGCIDGTWHSVLLEPDITPTPVPEPVTLALMGVGLIGTVLLKQREKD